jgi:hypothetical protein
LDFEAASVKKELAMQGIQGNCQNAAAPWTGQTSKSASQSTKNTSTQLTSVSTSQGVELDLTTKEGDKVSISLAASAQADYLHYLETGQDANGAYAQQLQMYSARSEQGFTISVDGNLSDQERSDLRKVLSTIDSIMADFVQGNLDPIAAKADKLSQLDTVSGFSLDMSYSRYVQQTNIQTTSDPLATYNSQGQLAGTQAAAASEPSGSAQILNQVAANADDATTAMAKQLAQVQDSVKHLLGALRRIFDKHRQQVEKSNPNDASAPALIDRMHDDLLAKMSNAQTAQPQEEAAAA